MPMDLLNQRWYVVGQPWLPSNMMPYITAGNEDPHVGIPVVDMMDADEFSEAYEGEAPDYAAICQHIVDLHNTWLYARNAGKSGATSPSYSGSSENAR